MILGDNAPLNSDGQQYQQKEQSRLKSLNIKKIVIVFWYLFIAEFFATRCFNKRNFHTVDGNY